MKMHLGKTCVATLGLLAMFSTIGMAISSAQGENAGGRIEGTWNARVTLRDCQTGSEIRSLDSLGTFMSGGTALDSTSGVPQALKTPGQGIWEHLGGNAYRFQFKSFSFDPAGNSTGWTIIKHKASLNQKANGYLSAGTAEVHAPNGILVFAGCSTTVATRYTFD